MSATEQDFEAAIAAADDSEEEIDWEEVQVPEQEQVHLEITLSRQPKQKDTPKKTGISYEERVLRINCHKIHTVCLLANAWTRNRWLNDDLLQARLLSLTPLPLQNSFAMIHSTRVPEQGKRGRMFEQALSRLNEWWANEFFEVEPEGHIRSLTYDTVQKSMSKYGVTPGVDEIDFEVLQDVLNEDGETIKGPKSLMKHALKHSGSRDTSSQLFTSLCRALGLPARLVVSVQSVPWKSSIGKPKPKYQKKKSVKGKEKATEDNEQEVEGTGEVDISSAPGTRDGTPNSATQGEDLRLSGTPMQKSEKAKGKEKAKPVIRLRNTLNKGNTSGFGAPGPSKKVEITDPIITPPVFWTEVFSRPDGRWLPVDPIRGYTNNRKVFDPESMPNMSSENRMLYVVALEEDGYGRDVTRRYAKDYGAKAAKAQGGNISAKGQRAWWERVLTPLHRPYRLHRDDTEDAEMVSLQVNERMPTSIAGFKDHPLYVLIRHLKQTEAIFPEPPETPELGKFRGESVYPRSSVVSMKTVENWLRSEGRTVKEGEAALKSIKMRASTVGRMRELEILKEAGQSEQNGEAMQGLYARHQTEKFVPIPVIDGKIPKNNFGNIDLYVPSMLPEGGVHVPFKGVAKIAKSLGFDYAEAVTGFEFKNRRAFPVIEGVVVAAENEQTLIEAFLEAERIAEEKAQKKKRDRAIKRWTQLIHGLRIRHRLQEQYAREGREDASGNIQEEPEIQPESGETAGGFLVGPDDVVKSYQLPRTQHRVDPPEPHPMTDLPPIDPVEQNVHDEGEQQYDMHTMDIDDEDDLEEVTGDSIQPKTMQELAEAQTDNTVPIETAQVEEEYLPDLESTSKDVQVPANGTSKGKAKPSKISRAATRKARPTRVSTRKKRAVPDDSEDEAMDMTPKKRTRQAPPAVASTRTLRSRVSMKEAQMKQQEMEAELDRTLDEL